MRSEPTIDRLDQRVLIKADDDTGGLEVARILVACGRRIIIGYRKTGLNAEAVLRRVSGNKGVLLCVSIAKMIARCDGDVERATRHIRIVQVDFFGPAIGRQFVRAHKGAGQAILERRAVRVELEANTFAGGQCRAGIGGVIAEGFQAIERAVTVNVVILAVDGAVLVEVIARREAHRRKASIILGDRSGRV